MAYGRRRQAVTNFPMRPRHVASIAERFGVSALYSDARVLKITTTILPISSASCGVSRFPPGPYPGI